MTMTNDDMIPKTPSKKNGVLVKVTRKHIDEAMQKVSSHCMIAEAIKDAMPDAKNIAVDLQTIRYTDPKRKVRCVVLTPRLAQDKLVAFDQGDREELEPFQFKMRPTQVTASGRGREGHAPKKRSREPSDGTPAIAQSVESPPELATVATDKTDIPAIVETAKKPRSGPVLSKPVASGSVPTKLGGKTPPLSVLARREFGLRVLRK